MAPVFEQLPLEGDDVGGGEDEGWGDDEGEEGEEVIAEIWAIAKPEKSNKAANAARIGI